MDVLTGGRRHGKTTGLFLRIIKRPPGTKCLFVTFNSVAAKMAQDQFVFWLREHLIEAKQTAEMVEFGGRQVRFVSYEQLANERNQTHGTSVYIDNADTILQQACGHNEVKAISITTEAPNE